MKRYQIILAALIGMSACKSEKPQVITYDLTTKDFVEKIYGTGTLESANNFTIVAPSLSSGDVKVAHLAPEGSQVKESDTVCILQAPDIQKYYDRYDDELKKGKADLARQEADNNLQISMLNAQLMENKARSSLTALDSVQLKFAPPVKQQIMALELKKSKILEQKITKKLVAQQKINEQTIRALKSQLIQKEQLVQRFQEQLDMLFITAPKPGMLVHATSPMMMFFSSSGGSGSSGGKVVIGSTVMRRMPLIELPDLTQMQVVIMVQEAEYKRIEKGQKVIINPESIKDSETFGTVVNKSLASQRVSSDAQVKSYKITVSIDSLPQTLLPGLSANCEIIIHNLADTIAVPSLSVFEKDSAKWVYVFEDEYFHPVEVETGISNKSETIISSGLKGSETIALLEPPLKLIKPINTRRDD